MMLQRANIHRGWFGGNGVIELWGTVTDRPWPNNERRSGAGMQLSGYDGEAVGKQGG